MRVLLLLFHPVLMNCYIFSKLARFYTFRSICACCRLCITAVYFRLCACGLSGFRRIIAPFGGFRTLERVFSSHSRSICSYSRSAGRIFMKFDIYEFYKELESHFSFHSDRTILTTLLEDLHAFLHVSEV